MSCNLPNTNVLLNDKNYKKPKRKRRKNKNKKYCSIAKKKFQKKFHRRNSSDPSFCFKTKKPQPYDSMQSEDSRGIMSNWYWSNYKKAIEWQDKHKIAHWKACALALQEENRYLMQIINSIQPGMCPDLTFTSQDLFKNISNKPSRCKFSKESKKKNPRMSESFQEDTNDDEYEFEMSEEMMQFFEQSFKHKMDLEKMKEERKVQDDADSQVKEIQSNRVRRLKEMELLYGEGASMIIGMETAVQLSFDKYCDTKSPKFWPNIPLKL